MNAACKIDFTMESELASPHAWASRALRGLIGKAGDEARGVPRYLMTLL